MKVIATLSEYIYILMYNILQLKSPPPSLMWRILIVLHEDQGFNCEDESRAEKMIVVGIWTDDRL